MGLAGTGQGEIRQAGPLAQQEIVVGKVRCQGVQHVPEVTLYGSGLVWSCAINLAHAFTESFVHHRSNRGQLFQFRL